MNHTLSRDAGRRDFRFFEKKLGKKLPCRVVARLHTYNFKNKLSWATTLQGKLLRSFSRKATTRPPHPPRPRIFSINGERGHRSDLSLKERRK